ncbi:MAG: SDR family oxidoreductase [Magnetococcales bacterium]|nr:SDR family oxidoreductase [Magnetococcales bacterium]MBF0151431.1 SDR family oxidoreductase [Magnetococcales bacterium]MBF0174387.1 SDR family oxidoreductase [Magnetococcales bacterium]MBF0348799.1 SDR family oxidoreductase [Magnetococcales bacterium]MBF0632785.1 SDR family oxidoreductase [Magnetococcales bacterium]
MDLQGQLALVTGGGRRIGAACVRALSVAGARVVVHCHRSTEAAQRLCQELQATGGMAWTVMADLADEQAVEALIGRVGTEWGPVTILVNNAAIFEPATVIDTSRDHWNRHLAINLTAPFFLMSRFARQLPDEAVGKVINIIDQRVLRPAPGHVAYTAAKSALWALTRLAARELAPRIQVNAIGPGAILPAAGDDETVFDRLARSVPMGRAGRLEEVTEALLFLLRHDYVTGEMLCVDGGQHL